MESWVDFHTHILDSPDLDAVVADSRRVHVDAWLVNSVDLSNYVSFRDRAKKYSPVFLGLGWHPESVIRVPEKEIVPTLKKFAALVGEASYLGETGLDYLYAKTAAERANQVRVFTQFIAWSVAHDKMIEVHTRHAKQEAIDLLLEGHAKKVILHWFSGNASQVETIVANQWVCTVGPTILNSPHMDKFIRAMPLDLIGLETDSPIPFDGKPSSPAWIPLVARRVAELKGVSLAEVGAAQRAIFSRFLPARDLKSGGGKE